MALVLAPGFMTDADLWRDVVPGLERFAPILYTDVGRDDSIAGMARRALADAPHTFVLVGFSMGGYIAREIARMAPDRVRALVLVATSARGDSDAQVRRKASTAARVAASANVRLSASAISESLHPRNAKNPALIGRIQAMGARLGSEVFRRQLMLDRSGDLDRLGAIVCPTLVIAAQHDKLRSLSEATELQQGIPGAELIVVEDVGHMIPLEAPDRLAREIGGWLDRKVPPAAELPTGDAERRGR